MQTQSRIGFCGLGYVGLTSAVCFASRGFKVTGLDINTNKINALNKGEVPIVEKGLKELFENSKRNLSFTTDYKELINQSNVIFITVGTPSKKDGSVDLSYVKKASREIGKELKKLSEYRLIAVKSTVPPGTTEGLVKKEIETASGKKVGDFGLASNPEFLREGSAIHDTFYPDRIVIGSNDPASTKKLKQLYFSFYGNEIPEIVETNCVNAELIKYASNSFLATKISFINEIARICQRIRGADVTVIANGIGLDKRIGRAFLNAGLGYGGSCLPKDVRAIISEARKRGIEAKLIKAGYKVNETQVYEALFLIKKRLGTVKGRRIAVLGLSFKPGTDDIRESVAIKAIKLLLKEGAKVRVYDPAANVSAKKVLGESVEYYNSLEDCIEGCEACLIATEWEEFKTITPDILKKNMKRAFIVDCRRILEPESFHGNVEFEAIGFGLN